VDLETDENGRPLIESNVAALASALKIPTVGTELGPLILTGHVQRLGLAPVETDPGNRLAHYEQIMGLGAADRTVYFSTVDDGGATGHVMIYSDAGRTALIGHTVAAAVGHQAVVEDNDSGLGGYVELTSIGDSANISVAFTLSRACRSIFIRPQNADIDGDTNAKPVAVGYTATPKAYVLDASAAGIKVEFADVCGLYVKGTAADEVYVTYKN
jgi:hypothetical protein